MDIVLFAGGLKLKIVFALSNIQYKHVKEAKKVSSDCEKQIEQNLTQSIIFALGQVKLVLMFCVKSET